MLIKQLVCKMFICNKTCNYSSQTNVITKVAEIMADSKHLKIVLYLSIYI